MPAFLTLEVRRRKVQYPHVIEDISFRSPRFVLCSCGFLVQNVATDDDLAEVFKRHRLENGARRHI